MTAKTILLVDDDKSLLNRLSRSLERKGFMPDTAENAEKALSLVAKKSYKYAVIDMRIGVDNGLQLVPKILAIRPDMRIVMLTGYGNIASAVSAVKVGVVDYLAKPASLDSIIVALTGEQSPDDEALAVPEQPMSADRARWEHIWRVFEECNRNVSETARQLNMHRRTLQRILAKHAPPK